MQGRKDFTPQLFYELSLDGLVPKDNFYRQVNQELDLHFLYKSTSKYYGKTCFGHAHQPPQYEAYQQPRNATGQQTRDDGSVELQPEEIPTFYSEKTECFIPSNCPETREGLGISESVHSRPQKLLFKPF